MLNSSEIELLLCQWLIWHDEIGLAILFGSHAKGAASVQSDVDFAIQLLHGRRMTKEDKLT